MHGIFSKLQSPATSEDTLLAGHEMPQCRSGQNVSRLNGGYCEMTAKLEGVLGCDDCPWDPLRTTTGQLQVQFPRAGAMPTPAGAASLKVPGSRQIPAQEASPFAPKCFVLALVKKQLRKTRVSKEFDHGRRLPHNTGPWILKESRTRCFYATFITFRSSSS